MPIDLLQYLIEKRRMEENKDNEKDVIFVQNENHVNEENIISVHNEIVENSELVENNNQQKQINIKKRSKKNDN